MTNGVISGEQSPIAEYAIAEQSEAYPRLTLAKIIIAEQSQAYPPINSS